MTVIRSLFLNFFLSPRPGLFFLLKGIRFLTVIVPDFVWIFSIFGHLLAFSFCCWSLDGFSFWAGVRSSPSLSDSEFAPGVLTVFAFLLFFGSTLTFRVGGIPSSSVSVESPVVLGRFLFLVILVVTLLFGAE